MKTLARAISIGAITAIVAVSGIAVASGDLPNALVIDARIKAAEGTPPPSYRETFDESAYGLLFHSVFVARNEDYREMTDVGPFHEAEGRYRGETWHQNQNGETIPNVPDPGNVKPDVYTTTVTQIAQPVAGYAIARIDAAGYGSKRYVDGSSWQVVRLDEIRASGTIITRYDDFRTVSGRTIPFHVTFDDGHPENDRDRRITSFEPMTVADTDLMVPPSRRTFLVFPAGRNTVSLPVREDHGKFFVRVDVAGRGLDLLLDSGAAGIALEDGVAKQLGLAEYGSVSNGVNAGRYRQTSAIVPLMKVGDIAMHDVVIHTVPSVNESDASGDVRAVGLLGFDFIAGAVLKLDYAAGTVTAIDETSFVPPGEAGAFDLDLRLRDSEPLVSIAVNGAPGERFLIDTGGYGSLLIFDRFARRNGSALVDEGGGGPRRNVRLNGIGGEIPIRPYQLKHITFGPVGFTDFLTFVVTRRNAYDSGMDGAIGPDFLRIFDVYLDYDHAKAYFVLNALGKSARS